MYYSNNEQAQWNRALCQYWMDLSNKRFSIGGTVIGKSLLNVYEV